MRFYSFRFVCNYRTPRRCVHRSQFKGLLLRGVDRQVAGNEISHLYHLVTRRGLVTWVQIARVATFSIRYE